MDIPIDDNTERGLKARINGEPMTAAECLSWAIYRSFNCNPYVEKNRASPPLGDNDLIDIIVNHIEILT